MSWKTYPLPELAELSLGKMLDQHKNRGVLMPHLSNLNVRWGEIELSGLRQMRFEEHELERFGLRYGDIVMCEGGEPGRCAIWLKQENGPMLQKALHRIRPREGVHPQYLFYNLFHQGRSGMFTRLFTGATILHMPAAQLAQVEVQLPPLPTQRRIAGILSAYDELIANNQRRIAILEEMARALYREWFVHYRAPGVVIGEDGVPEGWEVKRLGEIADVNRAQINARTAPEELHYIDIASVSPGSIDGLTTYALSDAPGRAKRIVQHGDILWSCVRPNRRSHALVMNPITNTIASTGFAVLTAKTVPYSYLYHYTTSDEFVGYLTNEATGAAYPAVSSKTFEKAEVMVPTADILECFGTVATPMFEQADVLRRQNVNLRRTRDLLLPRLMSGRVELNTVEV